MKQDMLRTKLILLVTLCHFIGSLHTHDIDREKSEPSISTEQQPEGGRREGTSKLTAEEALSAIEESLLGPSRPSNALDPQLLQSLRNTDASSFIDGDARKSGRDKRNKRTSPSARRYIASNYVMKEKPSLVAEATQNDFDSTLSTSLTPEAVTFSTSGGGRITSHSTMQLQQVTDKSVLKANANPPAMDTMPSFPNKPANAFIGGGDPYKAKKHHGKSVKESYGLVLKAEKRYDEVTTEGGRVKFSEISAEVMSEMERIENAADQDTTDQEGSTFKAAIPVRHRRGSGSGGRNRPGRSDEPTRKATSELASAAAEDEDADEDDFEDADIDLRAFRHVAAPRIEIT